MTPPPRWRRLGAASIVVVALLVVGLARAAHTLTYYETPTELLQHTGAADAHVRLGGLVLAGSVSDTGEGLHFTLTDGVTTVPVTARAVPDLFRGGTGAIVEGHLDPAGTFVATSVIVRHSDSYHPPTSAPKATAAARG